MVQLSRSDTVSNQEARTGTNQKAHTGTDVDTLITAEFDAHAAPKRGANRPADPDADNVCSQRVANRPADLRADNVYSLGVADNIVVADRGHMVSFVLPSRASH